MLRIILAVFCLLVPMQVGIAQPAVRLQPGDRVLFVGDEFTQQMFYTRGAAAALLALMPDADLRFFNGGREGAAVATAGAWMDELLALTSPTVVTLCFGLADAPALHPIHVDAARRYGQQLAALVDQVQAHPTVRQVALIGPPAIQAGMAERLPPDQLNHTLSVLSDVTQQVAEVRDLGFIDMFTPLGKVYLAAVQSPDTSPMVLSRDGRLPAEPMGIVAASVVLAGLGVTGRQLDQIGWSPLLPARMAAVRPVLALPTQPADLRQAEASHNLYMLLTHFDEMFFRRWRLDRPRVRQSAKNRVQRDLSSDADPSRQAAQRTAELQQRMDEAWQHVAQAAAGYPRGKQ